MSYTKRQFVQGALEEIGIASYNFDVQPDQLQSALVRLDAMLGEWNSRGIRLGYPLPSNPEDSTLDEKTNVPDAANQAIVACLAVRIAPTYGKQLMMETKQAAKLGYDNLLRIFSVPPQAQFPDTLPAGAGNKPWRFIMNPFLIGPVDVVDAGPDGNLEF